MAADGTVKEGPASPETVSVDDLVELVARRIERDGATSTTAAAETVEYWPSFFGFLGVACALVFANAGAAYGTARSGVGLAGMGITNPNDVMKNIIAVVMAGVLGIYGLIVAVILLGNGECHLMLSLIHI